MTVKDHILEGLAELRDSGRLSAENYNLLSGRADSMVAIISDCGSVAEAAQVELYGCDIPCPELCMEGGLV